MDLRRSSKRRMCKEMYERGDWIVPTFNGGLRTLKPPLHYYFMFGVLRFLELLNGEPGFFLQCLAYLQFSLLISM
jgi:4-amino-4-deoxy-L-arabinose transferase-like glycosyltransferase